MAAGENHVALTVVTGQPCRFEGKATLARADGLAVVALGEFVDYDVTTADGGDGKFVALTEYQLSLTSPKELHVSSSRLGENCTSKEYDGPNFMLKTGPGEYATLTGTLPAGEHVFALTIWSTKSCRVQGSFRLE